ncbi:MAG: hypothetical protein P4N41_11365 [Negativicutes bacterium]|nr:hypothetical protein [Negativicutes bacterium]
MVKPKNPNISPDAKKANAEVGFGPNNPEPISLKDSGKRNK